MSDNIKRTARIPIIPDSLDNRDQHKDKELLMDFDENDLYVLRDGRYVNITGQIRDMVEEIQDASSVIHIVTEETLPPIKDRPENHWYLVVMSAKDYSDDAQINTANYVYYGVINESYYEDKNYLLIAQNMVIESGVVRMNVMEGYKACFYVPTIYSATFFDDSNGVPMDFTIQDRIYCMMASGEAIAYDVFTSDRSNLGIVDIRIDFTGVNIRTVTISPNTHVDDFNCVTTIKVEDGNPVGKIPEPTWSNPRYIFKGWSTKKAEFVEVDPLTYIPKGNITIYAYFEYDADQSKFEYKSIYQSSSGKIINTFYSVAAPGTRIAGKVIEGYQATITEPQELLSNGAVFTFIYTPITYRITYNVNGGILPSGLKQTYTIEETYTPSDPTREGYTFQRWNPRYIKEGTFGDIVFEAVWELNGKLPAGPTLRSLILDQYVTIANITNRIVRASVAPLDSDNAVQISTSDTPIYMWYSRSDYSLKFYCASNISCDDDFSGVFENFVKLNDISPLTNFVVKPNTNISKLFKGCTLLTDLTPIVGWNLTGRNFSEAFMNTGAASAGRLPDWYIWDCTIRYKSQKSGKVLRTESMTKAPNSTFTPTPSVAIENYTVQNTPCTITQDGQTFDVLCTPVTWPITYNLDGGTITGQKTVYDVEDVEAAAYKPPIPTKTGFTFQRWTPDAIPVGNRGAVTFVASWTENSGS